MRDRATSECRCGGRLEFHRLRKDALTVTEHHRMDKQPDLVDEAGSAKPKGYTSCLRTVEGRGP